MLLKKKVLALAVWRKVSDLGINLWDWSR